MAIVSAKFNFTDLIFINSNNSDSDSNNDYKLNEINFMQFSLPTLKKIFSIFSDIKGFLH